MMAVYRRASVPVPGNMAVHSRPPTVLCNASQFTFNSLSSSAVVKWIRIYPDITLIVRCARNSSAQCAVCHTRSGQRVMTAAHGRGAYDSIT